MVYKATVTTDNENTYTGLSENTMIERIRDHKTSFKYQKYKHKTTLAKFIWETKENGKSYDVKWEILKKSCSYRPGNKICRLCLNECYFILYKRQHAYINKRRELFNICRHRDKFKLEKIQI